MASTTAHTIVPQEPAVLALPALRVFDKVPPWAVVHAVRDRSCLPLIRESEVAVIEDKPRTIPEDGGLYLIQYNAETRPAHLLDPGRSMPTRVREIVQIVKSPRLHLRPDGSTFEAWHSYRGCTAHILDQLARSGRHVVAFADGPYDDLCDLAERILGPVIGVYKPD